MLSVLDSFFFLEVGSCIDLLGYHSFLGLVIREILSSHGYQIIEITSPFFFLLGRVVGYETTTK
mgnify:CR=1 FL=1